MAKTNKDAILRLAKSIDAKEGEGSIYTLGSKKANMSIPRWQTGIEDLDHILGGGMPEGRIIEIFGPESSGKTSLGYHLAGLHDLALDIPIEGTFDAERAQVFGNRPKQLLVYRAKFGEQAMTKAISFAEAGIPLIIIDSVPACMPKEDIEKVKKAARTGQDIPDEARIGGVARLMSRYLPVLEEVCEFSGTTVILINQIRDKMNAMMFGEQTDTPGGRAIKFYTSARIQVGRKAWIEIPNKDPKNSAKTQKVGLIIKMKLVKSKVSNPMGEVEIPMFFDRGFVSFAEINPIRKELMKAAGFRVGKGGEDYDEEY